MNTFTYLAFASIIGVGIFWKGGLNTGTVVVFLVAVLLGTIPWYFGTRDRTKPPSIGEKILAGLWVWLRRLLGFTVGGAFMVGAVYMATSNPDGTPLSDLWLGVLALFLFGLFLFYLGLFGQGPNQSELRDDIRLHTENKKRYRWWF
jgi:hypothetical protein